MDARILAIETSGRQGSVAVAQGPKLLAARELASTVRHAAELVPAIQALVWGAGWSPSQIEQIYLSLGPGSFTGLRIAVAFARAMAQATGCGLVGVPSLDVIAESAPAEFSVVVPVLDAKRRQVFAARYERDAQGVLRQTIPAGLVDPAAFIAEAAARARSVGGQAAVLGEGVDYHGAAWSSAEDVVELDRALWPGRAETVHRLGYARAIAGQFADPQTLLPIYIRLPEAEEVYRKKHGMRLED